MLFNLNKEIDEIRLDYYILHTIQGETIEFTLNEIATLLNISKSRAQKLIEKFIKLNILEVLEKSNSKRKKTKYKYNKTFNYTDIYTDNISNYNVYTNIKNTNVGTDLDTDGITTYISSDKFEIDTAVKDKLKDYSEGLDPMLLNYLVNEIKNKSNIKNVGSYLVAIMKDLHEKNVKDIDGYFKIKEDYKKNSNRDNRKNWNYSTESKVPEDLEELARMTRYKHK